MVTAWMKACVEKYPLSGGGGNPDKNWIDLKTVHFNQSLLAVLQLVIKFIVNFRSCSNTLYPLWGKSSEQLHLCVKKASTTSFSTVQRLRHQLISTSKKAVLPAFFIF